MSAPPRRDRRPLRMLREALEALARPELEQAVATVAELLRGSVGADLVCVLELRDCALVLRGSAGDWADVAAGRVRASDGDGSFAALLLSSGEPQLVRDYRSETRCRPVAVLADHGVRSSVGAPIGGEGDEPYGVLVAHALRPRAFGLHELEAAAALADVLASAVRRTRAEARYRTLVERAPVWIHEIDREARVVATNDTGLALLGRRESEVCGHSYLDVVGPGDRARVATLLSQALEGLESDFEYVAAGPAQRVFASTFIPMLGPDGAVERLLGVTQDVTQRRRLEEQLRHAQKLDAVGQLAGGVAHDFNNLLTAIAGYADLALRALPEAPDDAVEDIRAVRDAAARARSLTQQLLAFSRRQVLEPRVVDPDDVVSGMEAMLRRLIGEQVELVTEACGGCRVLVDPGQLEQVLLNLVVNARDALPVGGRIAIRTRCAGRKVVLEVEDDGVGMSEEVRARVFEPFFTTKAPGKGTGLGLSTVYGIVEQSGGRIEVKSEPGRGSRFTIVLPAADEELAPAAAVPARPERGSETVLLVEDEDLVRALAKRVLAAQGYTVLEAADGLEALRIVDEHDGEIDLLLSDVVMPGLGGPDLVARVHAERPDLRCLFMSGYAEVELDPRAFIAKPFAPDSLARKVREVLDGRAS